MKSRTIFSSLVFCLFAAAATAFAGNESPRLVFGHGNPDTDTVIGSMALSELQNQRGMPSDPRIQGMPNPETAFVLKRFGLSRPALVDSVEGRSVSIVDFSDMALAPKGFASCEISSIVDHHKLGDITSAAPLEMWVWPVGSCNTIIKSMFDFYGGRIPPSLAGGMMCAILSDTLLLKSPTTTDADRKAVADLARAAGVEDPLALGREMFEAKADLSAPPMQIFRRDLKVFEMHGKKVGIAQQELLDASAAEPLKKELYLAAKRVMEEDGLSTVMFLVTDITKQGSEMLVLSEDISVVEKAFGIKLAPGGYAFSGGNSAVQAGEAWLEGAVSRKKQIVPPLMKAFGALAQK